jgi:hypothetical protein
MWQESMINLDSFRPDRESAEIFAKLGSDSFVAVCFLSSNNLTEVYRHASSKTCQMVAYHRSYFHSDDTYWD